MCEQLPFIKHPEEGDFVLWNREVYIIQEILDGNEKQASRVTINRVPFKGAYKEVHCGKKAVQIILFRQDQLQSLCGNIFPPYTTLIKNVAYYCADNEAYWDCFDSGEQFWLAYYMATKQGKHWNGEDWINE